MSERGKSSSSSGISSLQSPYLSQIYQQAQQQYGQPWQFYPGSITAERDPFTQQGTQQLGERGLGGSPVTAGAENLASRTLGGQFLQGQGQNPWLDQMFQRGARGLSREFNMATLPQLEARFGGAGRTGSPAYGAALSRQSDLLGTQLNEFATNIYGGAYDRERGRQQQTLGMAPGLAQAGRADIQSGIQAGLMREQFNQQLLNDLIQRFDFEQQEPSQRLGRFSGAIGQPFQQSQSSSSQNVGWLSALMGT